MSSDSEVKELEAEMTDASNFAKQWIVDHSDGKFESADDIEPKDMESFLSKGQTEYDRAGYYKAINDKSNTLRSVNDIQKRSDKIDSEYKSTRDEITTIINQKIDRYGEYEKAINEMKQEITDANNSDKKASTPRYEEILKNINPDGKINFGKKFKRPFEQTDSKGKKTGFKIYYQDVADNMDTGSEKGAFSMLKELDKDIETLFSVVENPLNFTISDKVKEEQAAYDEKQRQTKEAEIQSVVEDNVEGKILTETEINTKQKKLEGLKIKLDTVNLEIINNEENAKPEIETVDKDGKKSTKTGNIAQVQLDYIETLKEPMQEAFKTYIDLKNTAESYRGKNKELYNQLKEIKRDIFALKTARDQAVKDLNSKQGIDATSDQWMAIQENMNKGKKYTQAKNAAGIIGNLVRFMKDILNNLAGIVNQYKILTAEKESLEKEMDANIKKSDVLEDKALKTKSKIIKENKDVDIQQVERDLKVKEESKHKRRKIIQRGIKKLEQEIMFPHSSANILLKQSKRAKPLRGATKKDGSAKNDLNIPDDLSSYVTVRNKAKSLFSGTNIETLAKSNKYLQKLYDNGIEFILNGGIAEAISDIRTKDYVDILAPAMSLLTTRDTNSTKAVTESDINKNLSTATVVAVNEAIRNQAGNLYMKSDDEIARLLGVKEYELTSEQKALFRHRTRPANLANSIGKSIANIMDFKPRKDGDREAYARFITSLGMLGVQYMIHKGYLEYDVKKVKDKNGKDIDLEGMSVSEYAEVMGEPAPPEGDKGQRVQFLVTPRDKKGNHQPFKQVFLDANKAGLEELEDDNNKIIPQDMNTVQFSPPEPQTVDEREVKRNPYTRPSQETADALNNLEQQEHGVIMETFDMFTSKDEKEAEAIKTKILKGMGWKPTEEIVNDKTLSADKIKSTVAANEEMRREYDSLAWLYKTIENDTHQNRLWFNWSTPINNRLNLEGIINPQSGKELHRWLIPPKKSRQSFNKKLLESIDHTVPSSYETNDQVGFLLGVAQAFGFDIDKHGASKSIKFAQDIMNMKLEDIQKEYIDAGKFDHYGHALQAYIAIKQYKEAPSNIFYTTMTAEYDGITNGTILKLLQMPIVKNSAALLVKGAVVVKNKKTMMAGQAGVDYDTFESILDEMDENDEIREQNKDLAEDKQKDIKVLDIYFSGAVNAKLSEQDMLNKLTNDKGKIVGDKYGLVDSKDPSKNYLMDFIPGKEGLLTKAVRELFKYPTMIINYGGALISVQKSVARDAVADMIDKLLTDYHADITKIEDPAKAKEAEIAKERATLVLEKIASKTKLEVAKGESRADALARTIHEKPLYQIGYEKDWQGKPTNLETNLMGLFQKTVGEAVSDSIDATFGPMIKATQKVNESSRVMFTSFERALKHEIDKLLAEKKASKNEKIGISPKEMTDMVKKLKPLLPLFEGPGSIDRLIDGIAIFNTGITSNQDLQYGVSGVKYLSQETKDENGTPRRQIASRTARSFTDTLVAAYAAAGVLPTHTEDGYNMAKSVNQFIKQFGIIPVHDAEVLGGKGSAGQLRGYNTNMIETSAAYDSINSIAIAMREIYNASKQYVKDNNFELNLNEMRDEKTIKEMKKKLKDEVDTYKELSFEKQLIEMETVAEHIWTEKQKLFANDIKIDHMPGHNSMSQYKAKYKAESFKNELELRLDRRSIKMTLVMSNLLKIPENSKATETEKIEYSIGIIDIITKRLNGEC